MSLCTWLKRQIIDPPSGSMYAVHFKEIVTEEYDEDRVMRMDSQSPSESERDKDRDGRL